MSDLQMDTDEFDPFKGLPVPETSADDLAETMTRAAQTPQARKVVLDAFAKAMKAGRWPKTAAGRLTAAKFLGAVASTDGVDVQGLRSILDR